MYAPCYVRTLFNPEKNRRESCVLNSANAKVRQQTSDKRSARR